MISYMTLRYSRNLERYWENSITTGFRYFEIEHFKGISLAKVLSEYGEDDWNLICSYDAPYGTSNYGTIEFVLKKGRIETE